MKKKLDIASITVDECGRTIISDAELQRLERSAHGALAGAGTNYADCTYTTNGSCLNSIDCRWSSNGFCGNQGLCPKYQEQ